MHNGRHGPRRLGSRLSTSAAIAGRNFLTPELAALAHHVIAYQEPGAFLEPERVLGNACSSAAMCINVLGLLALDRTLAARVLHQLWPALEIDAVHGVRFEHSPGRLDPTLTGDRTAFDAVIFASRKAKGCGKAQPLVLAFEFKLTESLHDSAPFDPGRYIELADASGLFKDPANALLRVNPLQQLFREHLLAQAAVIRGDWTEAMFISVAPAAHTHAQRQAQLYASHLVAPMDGQVPFAFVTLDLLIQAIEHAGAPEMAAQLYARYLDWTRVDRMVAEALHQRVKRWAPRVVKRPLLAQAA